MWRLQQAQRRNSRTRNCNTENDAEEYGKGHEFATTTFKTSWDMGGTLEKYLSAEMAAWAMCFGLGKVVKSGSAANFDLHLHSADPGERRRRRNCRTSPSSSRSARALAS